MKEYYYRIDEIPDLSLAKYSGIDNAGVSGVIKSHSVFLKQLHTIGMLKNVSFHLFYIMDSEKEKGSRLSIVLMCRTESDDLDEIGYYSSLLNSTAIGMFYNFAPCNKEIMPQRTYKNQAFFSRQVSLRSSSDAQIWDKYFVPSLWEINKEARLYNTLKLVESMNKSLIYRVDLYPVDYNKKIDDDTRSHMNKLRQRASFRAPVNSQDNMALRDDNADTAQRKLRDFIDNIAESVHFLSNITVLHDDPSAARIILEYSASEIVSEGSYRSSVISGDFAPLDNISPCACIDAVASEFENLKYFSCIYPVEDIKAFFSFPALYDSESVELRKESDPKLKFGDIKVGENTNGYPVYLPLSVFAKHAYISGVPGSGKTYTMKHLITSLMKNDIPFLIFEPAKREYRGLYEMNYEKIKDMIIFSPSAGTRFPIHINPFEVPKGITVSEHITNIVQVFEGAFDLPQPLPFLLNNAIESIYTSKGWNFSDKPNESEKRQYPVMSEIYDEVENILSKSSYGDENSGNIRAMLQTRIGSLLSREKGEIFDVPESTFPPEKWLELSVLMELESLGKSQANFMTLLLSTLIRETLKANPVVGDKPLRHVIFFEEAHNLIGPSIDGGKDGGDIKTASTQFIVDMLAEVRALKEGIVIADQLPSSIAPQVLKNTGLKLAHRQMSAEERNLLGQVMSADQTQIERLAKYTKGQTLMTYESGEDDVSKPFEVQVQSDYVFSSDSPDDEALCRILMNSPQRSETLSKSFSFIVNSTEKMFEDMKTLALYYSQESDKILADPDIDSKEERKTKLKANHNEAVSLCLKSYRSFWSFKSRTKVFQKDCGNTVNLFDICEDEIFDKCQNISEMYNEIQNIANKMKKIYEEL